MLQNSLVRTGILVIAASGLLWLGAQLTRRAEWILPFTAGVGFILVLVGLYLEMQRRKSAKIAALRNEGALGAPDQPVA